MGRPDSRIPPCWIEPRSWAEFLSVKMTTYCRKRPADRPPGNASAASCIHQLRITVGQAIRDLELLATVYEPEDMENRVEYLPL